VLAKLNLEEMKDNLERQRNSMRRFVISSERMQISSLNGLKRKKTNGRRVKAPIDRPPIAASARRYRVNVEESRTNLARGGGGVVHWQAVARR